MPSKWKSFKTGKKTQKNYKCIHAITNIHLKNLYKITLATPIILNLLTVRQLEVALWLPGDQ
jgi:hypothetical protein